MPPSKKPAALCSIRHKRQMKTRRFVILEPPTWSGLNYQIRAVEIRRVAPRHFLFVAEDTRISNHDNSCRTSQCSIEMMPEPAQHASIVPESWQTANRFVTNLPNVVFWPAGG
jgi:hypothetical protein